MPIPKKQLIELLHREEDFLNKELGNFDKKISDIRRRKKGITKRISANMKYRNQLINELANESTRA